MQTYSDDSEHWYVDGSANQAGVKNGPGGCAAIRIGYKAINAGGSLSPESSQKKLVMLEYAADGNKFTTNNRMELTAVLLALRKSTGQNITFYTDSQYVMMSAMGKFKRGANFDLWREYDALSAGRTVNWVKVKAHSGDRFNDMVDDLAKQQTELFKEARRSFYGH